MGGALVTAVSKTVLAQADVVAGRDDFPSVAGRPPGVFPPLIFTQRARGRSAALARRGGGVRFPAGPPPVGAARAPQPASPEAAE